MKSLSRSVALGLIAAAFLPGSEISQAKTFDVHVGTGGEYFSPALITIEPGDKIKWIWDSSFHSTTSGTPGNPSGMWNSGVLNSGSQFEFEFDTVGTFAYYCSVHGSCCGMVGTVNVVAGSPSPSPSQSPSPSPSLPVSVTVAQPEPVSEPKSIPQPVTDSTAASHFPRRRPGRAAADCERADRA